MKKLSNTEAELKKSVTYKKKHAYSLERVTSGFRNRVTSEFKVELSPPQKLFYLLQ